ncbi:MAG: NTP transferase domain-containing protein [Synergistaceae bacterium]|nr:NTP transferase domain-containing protein [Synergistaceae bacterium]
MTLTLPVAVLAGGLATRLRPLTEKIPKSLVDIGGRPFIDWQLCLLRTKGIEDVVLCVGFLGERIEAYVGDGKRWGLNVRYSYDGEIPAGTGGAVKAALPFLGEEFFVLYGDSYLPIDYESVERAYKDSGKTALMTVYRNENHGGASNVVFVPGEKSSAYGIIECYSKKERTPRMRYIDYGLSCLSASLFAKKEDAFDLADLYSELAAKRCLAAFEVGERFYEVGSFEGIRTLTSFLER